MHLIATLNGNIYNNAYKHYLWGLCNLPINYDNNKDNDKDNIKVKSSSHSGLCNLPINYDNNWRQLKVKTGSIIIITIILKVLYGR